MAIASQTAYERFILAAEVAGLRVRANGTKAMIQCPAHDDQDPSLSVTKIEGQVLIHCHAGCATADILAALGLTTRDLFDDPIGVTYTYTDLNGTATRYVHRTPGKRFRQSGATATRPQLYHLPAVTAAIARGDPVYLTEGEKDVHALETLGVTATTSPMGASNWAKVDATPLAGAHVVIVPDRDEAGRRYAEEATQTLRGLGCQVEIRLAKVGKDAADHVAAGYGVDELAQAPTPASPVEKLLPLLDWHALFDPENEGERWIVEPLLAEGRHTALFSKPKAGKSLLVLEVAVQVSRGWPVLGIKPGRAYRVLYVDFENDPRGDLRERLDAMEVGPDDLANLCYLSFPSLAKLDTPEGALQLAAAVEHYNCEVVVIDTVSRAVGGEENSNDTWLAFDRNTGAALKAAGVALLRLDHSGKDPAKGMRGGSAKYSYIDAAWQLVATGETVIELECTDHRMPIDSDRLTLVRETYPNLHHRIAAGHERAGLDSRQKQVDERLDQLGVPLDVGRIVASRALREAGYEARNTVVAAVVKARKKRAQHLSGTGGDRGEKTPVGTPVPAPPKGGGARGQVDLSRTGPEQGVCPTCDEPTDDHLPGCPNNPRRSENR